MIHLLWPTVRPEMMKETHAHWMKTASDPKRVSLKVAVNTPEDRAKLPEFENVMVIGNERRGAPYAVFRLFQALSGDPTDIVVLVCDDTFSPPGWDSWLQEQFAGRDDAIVINDGGQYGPCVTQPIMTYGCVLKLNRVINHPSYHHFCADAELFFNLSEMNLLRDLRQGPGPVFEHRSWAWGKRTKDAFDERNTSLWPQDERNMHARLKLPVAERLQITPEFFT
jgi:hypothetical protein